MPNLKFLTQTVLEISRWSQNSKSRSRDPFTFCKQGDGGDPISQPQFAYSLYNFHRAAMTIKGSLQVSIAIVKAFLTRNFVSSKIGQKFAFWGKTRTKCEILFSGHPKGTSLRKTTLFDV